MKMTNDEIRSPKTRMTKFEIRMNVRMTNVQNSKQMQEVAGLSFGI